MSTRALGLVLEVVVSVLLKAKLPLLRVPLLPAVWAPRVPARGPLKSSCLVENSSPSGTLPELFYPLPSLTIFTPEIRAALFAEQTVKSFLRNSFLTDCLLGCSQCSKCQVGSKSSPAQESTYCGQMVVTHVLSPCHQSFCARDPAAGRLVPSRTATSPKHAAFHLF